LLLAVTTSSSVSDRTSAAVITYLPVSVQVCPGVSSAHGVEPPEGSASFVLNETSVRFAVPVFVAVISYPIVSPALTTPSPSTSVYSGSNASMESAGVGRKTVAGAGKGTKPVWSLVADALVEI
jgi:hypothetical protein